MSQTDPKSKQSKSTTPAPAPQAAKQAGGDKAPTRGGSQGFWYLIVFLVVAGTVAIHFTRQGSEEQRPVASADAEMNIIAEPVGESEPGPASLVIDSNVRGADVYLNGKRVGKTPHKATPLRRGEYDVRVAHAGYETFETRVRVRTAEDSLRADLQAKSGASAAPAKEDVAPTEADAPEPSPAPEDIRKSTDAVAVKHKHRLGSCEGMLRAGGDGVRFETDHKDAFFAAFADIEELALDGEQLTLKVRDGRKYDFSEQNDDVEALAAFQEFAGETVAKAESESR